MEETNLTPEQTSEGMEETLDVLDFGDEPTTAAPETEQKAEEAKEPETPAWTLNVKYNGEEKALSEDEARTYAQMGMNYEKLNGKYEEAQKALEAERNSKTNTIIDRFAQQAGLSREEYVTRLEREMERQEMEKLTEQGMSDELAKELLAARRTQNSVQDEIKELKDRLSRYEQQEEDTRRWAAFLTNHPDVKGYDALPDEVKAAIANGTELELAYTQFENRQLKAQLEAKQKNEKNAASAPGSLAGEGEGEALDPFQVAFMNALKNG